MKRLISILLLIGLIVWGKQVYQYICCLYVHYDNWEKLKIEPVELGIKQLNIKNGKLIKAFGYQALTPWDISPGINDLGIVKYFLFKNKAIIVFHNPNKGIGNFYTECENGNRNIDCSIFHPVFPSNLSYIKSALFLKPSFFSFLTSSRDKADLMTFQIFDKSRYIVGPKILRSIYHFRINSLEGFQIGDPNEDRSLKLSIFLDNEKEIEIYIVIKKAGDEKQESINQIIATFSKTQ